jgi:hypothetical protein
MKINSTGSAFASYGSTASAPSTSGTGLPKAFQDEMQQIADDPTYANQTAQMMAGGTHYAVLASHLFDPAYQADQAVVDSLKPKLSALYEADQAHGKGGEQTVSDMLHLEIAQPPSYWSTVDPDHLQSNDPKAFTEAELDTLQGAIAKG